MTDTNPKIVNSQHLEEAFTDDVEIKDTAAVQEMQIDPAVEKKLRWKIDLYLMPALWVLLVLSYIVRPILPHKSVCILILMSRIDPILGTQGLQECTRI